MKTANALVSRVARGKCVVMTAAVVIAAVVRRDRSAHLKMSVVLPSVTEKNVVLTAVAGFVVSVPTKFRIALGAFASLPVSQPVTVNSVVMTAVEGSAEAVTPPLHCVCKVSAKRCAQSAV